jgi:hypothetical protein
MIHMTNFPPGKCAGRVFSRAVPVFDRHAGWLRTRSFDVCGAGKAVRKQIAHRCKRGLRLDYPGRRYTLNRGRAADADVMTRMTVHLNSANPISVDSFPETLAGVLFTFACLH